MSRDLKEGGRGHEANWKEMAVAKPGSFVAHLGRWRLEERQGGQEAGAQRRSEEGERGGDGAERDIELDHVDPGPL